MIGRGRIALKYFVVGLVLGVLFAPDSGQQTRDRVMHMVGESVLGVLGLNRG